MIYINPHSAIADSAGTLPVIASMYDVRVVKILVRELYTCMQLFACYKKKIPLTFINLKQIYVIVIIDMCCVCTCQQ